MLEETILELTFTVYRDTRSNFAPLDQQPRFGVFRGNGDNWSFFNSFRSNLRGREPIDIVNTNPCIIVPSNLGVERGTYRFEVRLPWSELNYMITYQRCCRNQTINNIINPESTGATIFIEISGSALKSCNNSPVFKSFPPVLICTGNPFEYDHGAIDTEADSLVYEFCSPMVGGGNDTQNGESCFGVTPHPMFCPPPYDEVRFLSPQYSFDNPMGGNPQISIDRNTGVITGVPNVLGQFLVGVCVKEYRNGELIGEIRREFQFNVTFCQPKVVAEIEADIAIDNNFTIDACGFKTVSLRNLSRNQQFISNYYWEFDINGDTVKFNTRNVTVSFPSEGLYSGIMILNKGTLTEQCNDTSFVTVRVFPKVDADFRYEYDTCRESSVQFFDTSVTGSEAIIGWDWDIDKEYVSKDKDLQYTFEERGVKMVKLIAVDVNNCKDTITKAVNYFPIEQTVGADPTHFIGCSPQRIEFTNLSEPLNEDYSILWIFGDGNTSEEPNPVHVYDEPGLYSVVLQLISPEDCVYERKYHNWLKILDKPHANWDYTPKELSNLQKEATLVNGSSNASSFQWLMNESLISLDKDVNIIFPDTGIFEMKLIAINENACADTSTLMIDVKPLLGVAVPNAFTPDNNGLNDSFRIFGYMEAVQEYRLSIYNRYGQRVFYSENPEESWNGYVQNEGTIAQSGVYIYKLEVKGPRGDTENYEGSLTLIR